MKFPTHTSFVPMACVKVNTALGNQKDVRVFFASHFFNQKFAKILPWGGGDSPKS